MGANYYSQDQNIMKQQLLVQQLVVRFQDQNFYVGGSPSTYAGSPSFVYTGASPSFYTGSSASVIVNLVEDVDQVYLVNYHQDSTGTVYKISAANIIVTGLLETVNRSP